MLNDNQKKLKINFFAVCFYFSHLNGNEDLYSKLN
jgi:hypothetical protein